MSKSTDDSTVQHHVFMQEHRDVFAEYGINVDDFTVSVLEADHRHMHSSEYEEPSGGKYWDSQMDDAIDEVFQREDDGDPMSPTEFRGHMWAYAESMLGEYGYQMDGFEKYGSEQEANDAESFFDVHDSERSFGFSESVENQDAPDAPEAPEAQEAQEAQDAQEAQRDGDVDSGGDGE